MKLSYLIAGVAADSFLEHQANPENWETDENGERGGKHKHDKDHENYVDLHAEFDIDREYIANYAKANDGLVSCIDQCRALQAENVNSHYAQIFCYEAAE